MSWGFTDYVFEGECEAIDLILPLDSYYFNYKTGNHYLKKGKKYRKLDDQSGDELTRFLKNYSFKIVDSGKVSTRFANKIKRINQKD